MHKNQLHYFFSSLKRKISNEGQDIVLFFLLVDNVMLELPVLE